MSGVIFRGRLHVSVQLCNHDINSAHARHACARARSPYIRAHIIRHTCMHAHTLALAHARTHARTHAHSSGPRPNQNLYYAVHDPGSQWVHSLCVRACTLYIITYIRSSAIASRSTVEIRRSRLCDYFLVLLFITYFLY